MTAPDAKSAAAGWPAYHRRRRTFWAVLLLGPVLAIALAANFLMPHLGIHGLLWPLLAWLALSLFTGLRWQASRCPRCGHRFFAQSPPLLALRASQCVHCMLPKD